MNTSYSSEDIVSTDSISTVHLPPEEEVTVTIPYSMYKKLMRAYKIYQQEMELDWSRTYPHYIPDPIAADYTRPQPNDWPQRYTPWCWL